MSQFATLLSTRPPTQLRSHVMVWPLSCDVLSRLSSHVLSCMSACRGAVVLAAFRCVPTRSACVCCLLRELKIPLMRTVAAQSGCKTPMHTQYTCTHTRTRNIHTHTRNTRTHNTRVHTQDTNTQYTLTHATLTHSLHVYTHETHTHSLNT